MFNIMMIALVAILLFAKRRRRRKYIAGLIDHDMELSTLAANTLIAEPLADTVDTPTWISSIDAVYTLNDFTAAGDDGPIAVGWAHTDYTDAEIEEWFENSGNWSENSLVEQEVGQRKCRLVGIFPRTATQSQDWVALEQGRPVKTKIGWKLTKGFGMRLWAYNMGDSALATTSPQVKVNGKANLWPML